MSMRLTNIKARDGIFIPCGVWDGRDETILYLHGVESHMGWFTRMGDKLSEKDFSVYAFDRRGSGLSRLERGHIDNYNMLLGDISDVIKHIRDERPGSKLYLMGICGGGKFASSFAGSAPGMIDGLILISPAIKTKVTISPAQKLDVLLSFFINKRKKIPTPLRDDMFTKNRKFIKFIKEDKLSLKELTASFYREWALMDLKLSRKIFSQDIPILTVLAGDDPIVDNGAMAAWHKKLTSRRKTLKTFYGCCHFLPFQENLSEITDYITAWVKQGRSGD